MNIRLFGILLAAAGAILSVGLAIGAANLFPAGFAENPLSFGLNYCLQQNVPGASTCPAAGMYPALMYGGIGAIVLGVVLAIAARPSRGG